MASDLTPNTPSSSTPTSKIPISTSSTASTSSIDFTSHNKGELELITKYPWPKGSYHELPPFYPEIREKLYNATNKFFENHGIRLLKHNLPLKLPEGFSDLEEIAAAGKENPPYTSVYRHMCNLKKRILSNWSYIETDSNNAKDERNYNMPFNLRPMTDQINEQLDMMAKDLNDPEFTGILLTLHTARFKQSGFPEGQCLSKVIGGALVEGLATNDRCIKALWMHPQITPRTTRLILQAFIPRIMVESFDIDVEIDPESAPPFKFVYAMHDDLDRWPRQSWLLMASSKKMGLIRHYEPSTSSTYPADLDFDAHMDIGVSLKQPLCQCQIEKVKKSAKAQGWLERLIGCTEQQMYNIAPSKEDKLKLGLDDKKLGWIDLIPKEPDCEVIEDLNLLQPGNSKDLKENCGVKYNYESDEWCGLQKIDLIDISSDSEIFFRPTKRAPQTTKVSHTKKVKAESPPQATS